MNGIGRWTDYARLHVCHQHKCVNVCMWQYILLCLVEMQYQNQKQGLGSVWGSKARVGELTGVAVISIPVRDRVQQMGSRTQPWKGKRAQSISDLKKTVGTIGIIGTWFWRAWCQEVPRNW
jgi:hypothetical protein